MAEISAGTLYDVNKGVMQKQPILTKEEIEDKCDLIYKFVDDNDCYFMLLCHERRDYTLFRVSYTHAVKFVPSDLIECLQNRGKIQSIEKTKNGDALECWIKIDEESFCYYFFPYDEGVIDYGD